MTEILFTALPGGVLAYAAPQSEPVFADAARDDLLVRQYSTGMLGYYSGADMQEWRELGRGVSTDWQVIA